MATNYRNPKTGQIHSGDFSDKEIKILEDGGYVKVKSDDAKKEAEVARNEALAAPPAPNTLAEQGKWNTEQEALNADRQAELDAAAALTTKPRTTSTTAAKTRSTSAPSTTDSTTEAKTQSGSKTTDSGARG